MSTVTPNGGVVATTTSSDSPVSKPFLSQQQLWDDVVEADKSRDCSRVTATVFSFLLFRLQNEANLATGEAVAQLEEKFRTNQMGTYCVARKTVEPYLSCAFDKQQTPYHLFLVTDTKAHVREEYRKQGTSSAAQNMERLKQCGFLENATEAATKEKRLKAVRLPADLNTTSSALAPERSFDVASLKYYSHNDQEALELRNKCLEHASASREGVLSDALSFSGLSAVRTSVPLEQWSRTKLALQKQTAGRLPIAETAKAAVDPKVQLQRLEELQKRAPGGVLSAAEFEAAQKAMQREEDAKTFIREQLIPVGYQLIGATREPPHVQSDKIAPERFYALFDLYCLTERKYHFALSDDEYEWLLRAKESEEGKEEKEKQLRKLVAEKAMISDEKELDGITFENIRRHVHIIGRGATPL